MMSSDAMIEIDGSFGEGGGQIVRTSLALALVTGRAFRIENLRAGRRKPGLRRQHLTAVQAAAAVGDAEVTGAEIGSREITFVPGAVRPGEYRFDIGTAGSATLVLQTVLPPLAIADAPSQLILEGGTHNPMAPPADFLQRAFLPLVARMGPQVMATLDRHGFYPAGGGRLNVRIEPRSEMRPLELVERGHVRRKTIRAVVANLPRHIAEREADTVRRRLGWPADTVRIEEVDSDGPGNCVIVEIQCDGVTEVFVGVGEKGVPAEKVAARVAKEAREYLDAGVPVGEHLADQLLIPMAVAGGGRFRTMPPSEHTRTNIEVIRRFLEVAIRVEEVERGVWEIGVGG